MTDYDRELHRALNGALGLFLGLVESVLGKNLRGAVLDGYELVSDTLPLELRVPMPLEEDVEDWDADQLPPGHNPRAIRTYMPAYDTSRNASATIAGLRWTVDTMWYGPEPHVGLFIDDMDGMTEIAYALDGFSLREAHALCTAHHEAAWLLQHGTAFARPPTPVAVGEFGRSPRTVPPISVNASLRVLDVSPSVPDALRRALDALPHFMELVV